MGGGFSLTGQPELIARPVRVPGDLSSAAFPLVAALITPGSEIRLPGLGLNPLRRGLLETLNEMGARIQIENAREEGGEPSATCGSPAARWRGRGAGRSGAHDDRRVSDPRRCRRLRPGHHGDAGPWRAAGEGKRPPGCRRPRPGSLRGRRSRTGPDSLTVHGSPAHRPAAAARPAAHPAALWWRASSITALP